MESKKIGVFGGSFNPLHIGHLEILKEIKKLKIVDEILVIPNYKNPLEEKNYYLPARIRLYILNEVLKDSFFSILDYEISQKKAVPTIETISTLKKLYAQKKFHLILGSDSFASIHLWQSVKHLIKKVDFILFQRVGFPFTIPLDIEKKKIIFLKKKIPQMHSSTIREKELDYKSYAEKLKKHFK